MTTIGMKSCEKCGSLFKTRASAVCSKCANLRKLKHLEREGKANAIQCKGCRNVAPDVTFEEGYKTCNKCRKIGEKNRKNTKKINSKCSMFIIDDNRLCGKEVSNIKGGRYCDEHYEVEDVKCEILVEKISHEIDSIDDTNKINELVNTQLTELKLDVEACYLRRKIVDIQEKDLQEIVKINKKREIIEFTPMFTPAYYVDKIYNRHDKDALDEMDLCIEFVPSRNYLKKNGTHGKRKLSKEEKEEMDTKNDLWQYMRIHTSSIASNKNPGRHMKMFLKDRKTKKYLGIVSIGSDIFNLGKRDEKYGWTKETTTEFRSNRLKYVINITCCVGLQPVSYNYNIGKLLASMCFSKEVQTEYFNRYGNYIASIITLSLYGKSIQYDRLKYLKYIGQTKGQGFCLPNSIYRRGYKYLLSTGCWNQMKKRQDKMRISKILYNKLGLSSKFIIHGKKRGIYLGFTSNSAIDFIKGKSETFIPKMETFEEIFNFWKNKHAMKRYAYLEKENRLKKKLEIRDYIKLQQKCEQMKVYNEAKKLEMGISKYHEDKNNYIYNYRLEKGLGNEEIKFNDIDIHNSIYNAKYLGGLYDADGSIFINKTRHGYVLKVCFSQTRPEIMKMLQMVYGGKIYVGKNRKLRTQNVINENDPVKGTLVKQQYDYVITGKHCDKILDILEKGCIKKYENTQIAKKFLKYLNVYNTNSEKEKLYTDMTELNRGKQERLNEPYNRVDTDYICGIFDGDGYIYSECFKNRSSTNKVPRLVGFCLVIIQKSDLKLLEHINNYVTNNTKIKYTRKWKGKVKDRVEGRIDFDAGKWYCNDPNILDSIIIPMEQLCIIKKVQVSCIIEYIKYYMSVKKQKRDIEYLRKLHDKMHYDKHYSSTVSKEDLENNNKAIEKEKKDRSILKNTVKQLLLKFERSMIK